MTTNELKDYLNKEKYDMQVYGNDFLIIKLIDEDGDIIIINDDDVFVFSTIEIYREDSEQFRITPIFGSSGIVKNNDDSKIREIPFKYQKIFQSRTICINQIDVPQAIDQIVDEFLIEIKNVIK